MLSFASISVASVIVGRVRRALPLGSNGSRTSRSLVFHAYPARLID